MRYFIDLSYSGANYHGWQKQPNAVSVQEVLEDKLAMVLRNKVEVLASGRTDTGVHARQQVVHLDTEEDLNEKFLFRMNCVLPHDISINRIHKTLPEAHARFDAVFREYEYVISPVKNPFLMNQSWQLTRVPDLQKMNEAAVYLLEYKDFQCFSKVHTDVHTFNCDISYAAWEERMDGTLVFRIRANRFLRGMVRAIVGTLVNIGQGKDKVEGMKQIIVSKDRGQAGSAAPPDGLFLSRIAYPLGIFLNQSPGLPV